MGQVFLQFLWLGCISFGGPAAHIGYFQRTFVQRLGWLSQAEYAQLLALCQLLPGPASSQLGFAIGRHRAGLGGALAAFIGFTLPSFLLLLAAAIGLGQLTNNLWLDAALHGLKLLALVVVADAVLTMSRQFCKTVQQQGVMVATAAALWWQPGLLTQLGMLLGAALLCAQRETVGPLLRRHKPVASPTGRPCCCLPCCLSACRCWPRVPPASWSPTSIGLAAWCLAAATWCCPCCRRASATASASSNS